jgi:transcription initiation factor TFIIF subunit beta
MEDIDKDRNQMWLLKLPDFLYKALQTSEGRIAMDFNPDSSQIQLKISGPFADAAGGIDKFTGSLTPVQEPLYVFSVDTRKRVALKAKIIAKTSLNPDRSVSYDKLARSRFMTSSEGIATTSVTSDIVRAKRRVFKLHEDQLMYTMSNGEKAADITARRQLNEKRVRGDRGEVQEQLFELFKAQRYWKLKALANETDQPEAFLNEILGEVAVKETQGTYRNHWKLKPEYCSDSDEEEPTKRFKKD